MSKVINRDEFYSFVLKLSNEVKKFLISKEFDENKSEKISSYFFEVSEDVLEQEILSAGFDLEYKNFN